ncbi:sigma-70 family RNA polymerase sigma factor [Oscillatoriales cyanobacterium LEGE 11467]|uniref:Sigma-70 family RNA polymerase sigma factor n=2 Tax=Zarconia TaxID=2992130 RepID=A0A928W233_9CYAN|nr:sigma-70 family RNA polymerase sigma factor [Zarconia navalis LEGE 11467]
MSQGRIRQQGNEWKFEAIEIASPASWKSQKRSKTLMFPNDAELDLALKSGDRAALGTIYDRYGSVVYGLALKMLADPQEAEDLTQEVFLTLWRQGSYNPDRGSLGSFLTVMTRSRALDRLRSRSRKLKFLGRWGQTLSEKMGSVTPFEEAAVRERRDRVRHALKMLPAKQRQILELSYYQGLSQSAIAQRLELPLGTVKTRSRQGLLKLRQCLQDAME